MGINKSGSKIIGAAIEVHKALGPGLLESAGWDFLLFGVPVPLYSAVSAKSKKKITLCDLCGSAVNYYQKHSEGSVLVLHPFLFWSFVFAHPVKLALAKSYKHKGAE